MIYEASRRRRREIASRRLSGGIIMESNFWMRFVLGVLATWRITHFFSNEDGPGNIIVRIRRRLGRSFLGRLMDCFQCLSLWVAAPIACFVTRSLPEAIMVWLALSGAACLLERLGQKPVIIEPISEDKEIDTEDVLRSETISAK